MPKTEEKTVKSTSKKKKSEGKDTTKSLTARVHPDEVEKLRGFDTMVTMKRVQLGEMVEKMLLGVDEISYIRSNRSAYVAELVGKYNIPENTRWSIDPTSLEVVLHTD